MYTPHSHHKLAFSVCLVLIIAHVGQSTQQIDKMARIQVASVRNFPFTMQLRNENGDFVGAGALISPNHVLTAAKIFDENDYTKTIVVGGASKVTDEGVHRRISKVTTHQQSDVSVLKLSEPMPLDGSRIKVVYLMDEPITENTSVYVMGWRHIATPQSNPGYMYGTKLAVSPQRECEKEFKTMGESNIFCVTGVYDDQYCVGDLGSPAVTKTKKLAGITLAAHNCLEAEHVTSFVDVFKIRSFLMEATNEEHEMSGDHSYVGEL